jgi:hypothetical protein
MQDKDPIIASLERSLIDYLSTKKDVEEKVNGGFKRVRGLSLSIDRKNPKHPYFNVQIGICEASFNTVNGLKERGNCFGLEKHIRDWFERSSVQADIQSYLLAASRSE